MTHFTLLIGLANNLRVYSLILLKSYLFLLMNYCLVIFGLLQFASQDQKVSIHYLACVDPHLPVFHYFFKSP